jgi:glycosyltransferase involved in cell wall biosynthesis
VLFVLEYFHPAIGGVETLFSQLAVALATRGYEVSVLTLSLPGTPTREVYRGVEIHRVRAPRWASRYLFTLWAVPGALRLARRADLVHTTTYNAAIPAWIAARCRRKPCAITVHEVFAEQWNSLRGIPLMLGYGYRLFEWCILRLPFGRYVCVSEFTRQRLTQSMGVPLARTAVVYPALDYDFWQPSRHRPRALRDEWQLPRDTFLYLYFGRPGVSKGLEYLIEAVRRIRREVPGSRFVLLLGRNPEKRYRHVLREITRLGLGGHAIVLESVPRDELPGYLLAADCVVVPSVSEGFGYAAAEAATLGCRVVATGGHAVQEILEGHVRLVPPRDPGALADAIVTVARTRPPVRRPPARFDLDAHTARVTAVYDDLTGKTGPP